MLFTFKIFGLYRSFHWFLKFQLYKIVETIYLRSVSYDNIFDGENKFCNTNEAPLLLSYLYNAYILQSKRCVSERLLFLPKYALFEFQYGNVFKNILASSKSSCGLQHYFKFSHGRLKFLAHSPKNFFLQRVTNIIVFSKLASFV